MLISTARADDPASAANVAQQAAAQRAQSANNIKQIGLALLICESANKKLPAHAICDKDGKALLSWRVLLLPYLENATLYQEFHLDEPWDSEHNKKLLEKMPDVYRDPRVRCEPDKTAYLAVVGTGLAFEGNEGIRLRDIRDGTSKTLWLVEVAADASVPWTKPDDWQPDDKDSLKGLADVQPEATFQAQYLDGRVETIKRSIDPKLFKAMLTRNGGEPYKSDDIPRP
jgi:hypothetical protein